MNDLHEAEGYREKDIEKERGKKERDRQSRQTGTERES